MDSNQISKQMKEIDHWKPYVLIHELRGYKKKDSALSTQARKVGNQLFAKKNHDENAHRLILLNYTKSIALAVENSEEQALGYSNRSVLLLHLHKYKKCLIDVNRAYKITQSEDLKKKLMLRKEKCLELLDNENDKVTKNLNHSRDSLQCPRDATFYANFISKRISDSVSEELLREELKLPKTGSLEELLDQFDKSKMPKLTSQNETIPCYSKCLSLQYNNEYGRHVLATRDIKPGEILTVEKGFVFPRVNHIYVACSYCLNFSWNAIPCPHCIFAIYCSEKCKTKAWEEYHDIECSVLPSLFSEIFRCPDVGSNMGHERLTLRLFIRFVKNEGLQNIIDQAKSIDKDKNVQIDGFLTNGKFDNTKFKSFYNLSNHEKDVKKEGNQSFSCVATILLSRYTNIFEEFNSESAESLIMVQTKNIIIKLKTIIDVNSYCFQDSSCKCKDTMECINHCPKNLGIIVTPCSSLLNHSCCPNVFGIFSKGGKRMLYCTRPIKKNEQVFLSLGPIVSNEPKIARQTYLKTHYHFTCKCEPCRNNWLENPGDRFKEFDPVIVSKIEQEISKKISQETRAKKLEYISLTVLSHYIELSYKYFKNRCKASRFADQHIIYLDDYIHKMYGIELKIPKTC